MKQILTYLKKFLSLFNFKIISAVLFISFILHVRLFRKFYDIPFTDKLMKEYVDTFFSLFIINLFITLIMFHGVHYLFFRNPKKVPKILHFVLINMSWIFTPFLKLEQGKEELYTIIFNFIGEKYQNWLIQLTKIFLDYKKFSPYILYLGIILPRFLIVSILIIEIYLKHLKYYYYSLLLLIIPLIVQLVIYIFIDIGPRVYPGLESCVVYVEIKKYTAVDPETGKEHTISAFDTKFKPEYEEIGDWNKFMLHYYLPMYEISLFMEQKFLPKYKKIVQITLFSYFLLQSCCWGYIYFSYC